MKFAFTLISLFMGVALWGQLMVRVTSLPSSTPEEDNVHITGNFNDWDPSDNRMILRENQDGSREISLFPEIGKVEYKFTRGSWETVEGGMDGAFRQKRSYQYDGKPSVVNVAILSWEDLDGKGNKTTTATRNVHLMDNQFYIPQLDRYRRVWIYLPPDYEASGKHYPVVYMTDGQNLFDESTSYSGEWKVDETMNKLFDEGDYGAIVIGVENGGWRRLDEYSPWYNDQLEAGGEGRAFVDFVVKTLKPYVDVTYRTLPDREFTAMMGSSMGGLITHYAALEYQDIIGRVGVFSPALWFSDKVYDATRKFGKQQDLRYYSLVGKKEGSEMLGGVRKMNDLLSNMGFSNAGFRQEVVSDGEHNEVFWSTYFADAYKWLFANLDLEQVASQTEELSYSLRLKPNPAYSELWIENSGNLDGAKVRFVSLDGKMVRIYDLPVNGPLDIRTLSEGQHVVSVIIQDRVIFSDRLVIARS